MAVITRGIDVFEEVKNSVSILDVVRYYTSKTPNHAGFICCPFHGEKTPSLKLYPKSNSFYCYGCAVGGDVIKYVKLALNNSDSLAVVKQIDRDFCLNLPFGKQSDKLQQERIKLIQARKQAKDKEVAFKKWVNETFIVLAEFIKLNPTAISEKLNPEKDEEKAFLSAKYQALKPLAVYIWDMLFGCKDLQSEIDFYKSFKYSISEIKETLKNVQKWEYEVLQKYTAYSEEKF